MKKLGISIVILLSWTLVQAQTLQFSQVKLITAQDTVPTGKVWKVENYMPNTQLATSLTRSSSAATDGGTTNFTMNVNGNEVYLQTNITREVGRTSSYWNQDGYATSVAARMPSSIYWLPDGSTLAPGTGLYAISIIEFTVVP